MSTKQALSALTRREALLLAAGATIVAAGGVVLTSGTAHADQKMIDDAVMKLIGDKKPAEGKITFDLPQIAENGNTVPVGVTIDSPMTAKDYVKSVHLFADGNPAPEVATLHFTPMSGKASAATRMRAPH